MNFSRVSIRNFLSIGAVDIDFAPGLHLVTGRNLDMNGDANGVGKTAIFDAVLWALFGSARGLADDVINRTAGADCYVSVELQNGAGPITITRYRGHGQKGNRVEVDANGEALTPHTAKEAQALIDRLLPVGESALRHAVMVGQGMPHRFLSLPEKQKQEMLCHVSGVDLYDLALDRARQRYRDVESETIDKRATVGQLRAHLETLLSQRRQVQESLDRLLAEDKEDLVGQIANLDNEISRVESEGLQRYNSVKAQRDAEVAKHDVDEQRYQKMLDDANDALSRSSAVVEELTEASNAASKVVENARAKLSKMDVRIATLGALIRSEDAQHEALQAKLNERVSSLIRLQKGTCPTCLQEITEAHVDNCVAVIEDEKFGAASEHAEKIHNLQQQEATHADARKEVVGIICKLEGKHAKAYKRVEDKRAGLRKLQRDHTAAFDLVRTTIAEKSMCAAQYDTELRTISNNSEACAHALRSKREALQRADQQRGQQQVALRATMEANDALIAELQEKTIPGAEEALATAEDALRYYEFWRTSVPRLRASAVSGLIDYTNARIAEYMDELSGGAIGVELYQEKRGKGSRLRAALRTDSGSYEMSSGGEKRRIDIAVYLALADLLQSLSGLTCNLMVCDEITDGLSPLGSRQFLELLRRRADNGMCVYVTTHDLSVRNAVGFDSVLFVEKSEGVAGLRDVPSW